MDLNFFTWRKEAFPNVLPFSCLVVAENDSKLTNEVRKYSDFQKYVYTLNSPFRKLLGSSCGLPSWFMVTLPAGEKKD